MDATEQATEQLTRMVLLGSEYTLRLTGAGAKNLAAMIATAVKGTERTKGKIRLESLLKSGRPLSAFEIWRDDVEKFAKEAKRYGILYTLVGNTKDAQEATVDVLVKADDAARINRITEKLELGSISKDKVSALVEDIKEAHTQDELPRL